MSEVDKAPGWSARREALASRLASAFSSHQTLLMGIVNVTPDSFSDGGSFVTSDSACAQAQDLCTQGADIVDIGGESTRPGASFVPPELELSRVMPVISSVAARVPLSIDTYKAQVAREAVRAGAIMVNDIWGLRRDPAMAPLIAETEALAVLMHNHEAVDAARVMRDDLRLVFADSLKRATQAGIALNRLLLDPGIGFAKTDAQNLDCVRLVGLLRQEFGLPVLLGLSRKSFLGRLLGRAVGDRQAGTLAANLFGVRQGATVLRVHDVGAHADALKIDALLHARPDAA